MTRPSRASTQLSTLLLHCGSMLRNPKVYNNITLCCSRMNMCADFIEPAVDGTLSMLKSAAVPPSNGSPGVSRIVIVASTACVFRMTSEPVVLSEKDWNDQAIEEVERLGGQASFSTMYNASKTLAEKGSFLLPTYLWRTNQNKLPGLSIASTRHRSTGTWSPLIPHTCVSRFP